MYVVVVGMASHMQDEYDAAVRRGFPDVQDQDSRDYIVAWYTVIKFVPDSTVR